ncbi:MAG: hypothetical protein JXR31_09555 [Prolixibacteraceae bacterium]|nr:hypothetical protein [Prolixibacteraceae bacterium]
MQNNEQNEKFIDEVLKTDPGFKLPDDFADRLALKFEKHFAWSQYIREFLIWLSVGLGIILTTVGMLILMMTETWHKWFGIVMDNLTGSIGILFILTFILFIDRVLLRYFSFRLRSKPV